MFSEPSGTSGTIFHTTYFMNNKNHNDGKLIPMKFSRNDVKPSSILKI